MSFLAGLGSEDEVRLVEYLFDRQGYNPLIRPVRNLTEKVNVKFGLAMIQLINVVSTILQQFLKFLQSDLKVSADLRWAPGTPPGGPNSFNFMQFLGKIGQIIAFYINLWSWGPTSGKS